MWAHLVVVVAPVFDDERGLFQVVVIAIELFIPKLRVEALAITIFPRAPRYAVGRSGSNGGSPALDSRGDQTRAVVRPEITRRAL